MTVATRLLVRGPARALVGDLSVPGDKSIGHRAVMLGALAAGRVTIRGLSGGEDNRRTAAALGALGVGIREDGPGGLVVDGVGLDGLRAASAELDCGNSGTSIRLLCGVLAPCRFESRLSGDRYLQARPMRRIAEPLGQMGARVAGAVGKKPGEIYPPLTVGGGARGLRAIRFVQTVASAQVKSAILLAGIYADGATTVVEPSRSRDHTERMLVHLGAPLSQSGLETTIDPRGWARRLEARPLTVPGDLSSAAFLLAAALVVPGSRVTIRGVGVNPTRTGFLDAAAAMGGRVVVEREREESGEPVADLTCASAPLVGTRIAGELAVRAIDELPLLAAMAAHAVGTTIIADAAELRVKESDRVASTARMLRALDVEVEERPDGLVIQGRGPSGVGAGVVDSHGDHRIAMAGAICALGGRGESRIDDVENIATSFPGFAASLARLGADLAPG